MTIAAPIADQVEELAEQLHDVYQLEAYRKNDVRHPDAYTDLDEGIKEYDRVIARFVLVREAAIRRDVARQLG